MLQDSPMYAYLPATDVARARAFYEGTLGFRPAEEIAGGVVYRSGSGTACFLYPTKNAGTNRASQAFWQVADVEREVAELKARGAGPKRSTIDSMFATAFGVAPRPNPQWPPAMTAAS